MPRFRRVLVGVDLSSAERLEAAALSEPTRHAIETAIKLARQQTCELTFAAAIDLAGDARGLLAGEVLPEDAAIRAAALGVLEEVAAQARAVGATVRTALLCGTPWEELTKEVLRNRHDLVVVGTRKRSVAGQFLFGNTGLKLLKCCPCAVWIARPPANAEDVRYLIASDLTPVAQTALHVAVEAAQLAGAKLHVLHAFEDPFAGSLWRTGLPAAKIRAVRERERQAVERRLHEQLAATDYRTLKHGVQVHVVDGPPDVVILDALEQFEIDLLVMGTAARGGLRGLLLGNTAERLLSQASCSTLAVKPADFVCPISLD